MFSTTSLRSTTHLWHLSRRSVVSQQPSYRLASTLILSDPLTPTGETPAATQSAVTAAAQLGTDSIDLLVVGGDQPPTKIPAGVKTVFHAPTSQPPVAETVASTLQSTVESKGKDEYTFVVGTSSKFGATVMPRAAALLGTSPVTDIIQVLEPGTIYNEGDSFCKNKQESCGWGLDFGVLHLLFDFFLSACFLESLVPCHFVTLIINSDAIRSPFHFCFSLLLSSQMVPKNHVLNYAQFIMINNNNNINK